MSDSWHSLVGNSGYVAGAAGTATIPKGACILQIVAHSTAAGSFTIFGGPSIPVPAGMTFSLDCKDTLLNPNGGAMTVVFTGTDSYFVRYVREGHAV